MLGYVVAAGRGQADRLICEVAELLRAEGALLAGAVQVNPEGGPATRCDMDLHILAGKETVRISQDLGALSEGCRLDPGGLERAVGLVAEALDQQPDLLIINKFGKQEADGRGFRAVIGDAMTRDIPVLVAVNPAQQQAFLEFAGGLSHRMPETVDEVATWCQAAIQEHKARL